MQMIRHIKGNLIDLAEQGVFDHIVHGCNCLNTMGSGLAYEIRKRYPLAYEVDKKTKYGDRSKLGTWTSSLHCVNISDSITHKFRILNLYTQFGFRGSKESDVFAYNEFEIALAKYQSSIICAVEGLGFPPISIGFPKIGCGLAGGNWDRILCMMEEFSDNLHGCGYASVVHFD